MINTALMIQALPQLLYGAWISIQIAMLAWTLGFTAGIILAFLQTRKTPFLSWLISVYVTLIRGTPMLIQITFFYYVVPTLGVPLSSFWTAIIAIGINSSAYISQIIKSGINAVGVEQIEAAQVLGFTPLQTARYIVAPQALRITLPALAGECITLIKDSSLASVIGVMELYKEVRALMNQTYDVISVFCLAALLYLIMTSIASCIFYILERKMNAHVNPS
jgi:His/Glu/Gln/Arg/opine family amino acid ABC transporter permease subunit